ncbi:hypothetical protein MNEG_6713 [Monoraphidium neglectum]|uniref:TLC domain-containing protein n=1 Tax=Monoraphidium neglectum TaxID=145388 RepID=A0A0D2JQ99_9CHLO|nr:hypothetical protein MNEG_6713 [Monoraphidium neglectum]KIZ01248.1 hypothetical protein MNEG_6713 [Monoraphidium neglectum]|eukprot:XP_013900267.1 hypothetical protein MNEG_6713 [Monoraphidium neglectum]
MRTLGYSILVWMPVAGGAVFLLAAAVSIAIVTLPGLRAHFISLDLEQRLVSGQHALFVVVFGLQIVPYTVLFAKFFFERWSTEYFTGVDDGLINEPGVIMGALVTSHAFMYCAEGGLRATVKPSRLLLVHHALFFVLMASSLWTGPSLLMVKATIVLDLGAVHELPLYIALLLYRLSSSTRLVRAWLVAGMVWYGFTRVVQTGLLIWLLITVDARLRPTTPFVIFVIVAAALSGVQAYTFKIYGGMYKRAPCRKIKARPAPSQTREVPGSADVSVAIKDVSVA